VNFIMERLKILTVAGLFLLVALGALADWRAGVETGAVFSGYNDVRVPNDGGTEISLSRDLDTDPTFFYRLNAGYTFGEKHAVAVLVAPLTLKAGGSVPRAVVFDGIEIPANAPIDATYRFDSYRLSYRYNIVRRDNFGFGLGGTAKIRDAAITLKSGALEGETTNTGFVPLLNFGLWWTFADGWTLLFDGDALAGPQGRAEDVLVAVQYDVNDHFSLKSGYRMLEGGADVDQVYNFTMLHYIVVGPSFEF
jgi:hypothetical protein